MATTNSKKILLEKMSMGRKHPNGTPQLNGSMAKHNNDTYPAGVLHLASNNTNTKPMQQNHETVPDGQHSSHQIYSVISKSHSSWA